VGDEIFGDAVYLIYKVEGGVGIGATLFAHDGGVGRDHVIEDDQLHGIIEYVQQIIGVFIVVRFREDEDGVMVGFREGKTKKERERVNLTIRV
jgi:hypothetical protein